MPFHIRRVLGIIVAVALLSLAACGGQPAADPTAESTVAPTEEPTAEPTEAPTPTEEPTAEPTEEPAEESTGDLQEVEIGNLVTFTSSDGIFSIDIPENWDLDDRSKADEIIMLWTDPTNNGLVAVDIFEREEQATEEELTDFLEEYLSDTFGNQPDFFLDDPIVQNDGSILIVWTYTAEATGGIEATLLANSFIEQREDKVSILSTLVPQEQFDMLLDYTNEIINSYTINTDATIGGTPPDESISTQEVEIGSLQTYTHPTGLFSIDIPENWSLTDSSKADEIIMLWFDPTNNGLISVDLLENTAEPTEEELTEFLQQYLDNTFGSQQDFFTDEPTPQNDGSVLIIWSYTSEASGGVMVDMLGNTFIEQRGDKLSIMNVVVPDEQFDALEADINEIINSYQIDPSVSISG